jgi:hypothetical protein
MEAAQPALSAPPALTQGCPRAFAPLEPSLLPLIPTCAQYHCSELSLNVLKDPLNTH